MRQLVAATFRTGNRGNRNYSRPLRLVSAAVIVLILVSAALLVSPASNVGAKSLSLQQTGWPPGVVRTSNGKLQVFVVKDDKNVWSRKQNCPGCSWGPWSQLSGIIADGRPVAAVAGDGSVHIFALGHTASSSTVRLYHLFQLCDGCSWNGWNTVDSSAISLSLAGPLSIGVNSDGRVEVFFVQFDALASGKKLYHAYEVCAGCPGNFSSLGLLASTSGLYDSLGPGVGVNSDGRLELFMSDGLAKAALHIYQCSGCAGGWSGVSYLHSSTETGDIPDIGVGQNSDGRLEVFIKRGDHTVGHSWETTAGCSTCWTQGWDSLGGSFDTGLSGGVVAVGLNSDGRLEIFLRGTDNHAYHRWQNCANCAWNSGGWSNLGGSLDSSIAVGQDADGRLEVFARGSGGDLQFNFQNCAGCGWHGWASLGS
jgi:hypothetical protein